jgi:hypothetical protein
MKLFHFVWKTGLFYRPLRWFPRTFCKDAHQGKVSFLEVLNFAAVRRRCRGGAGGGGEGREYQPVLPGPTKPSLPLQPKTTAILAPSTATYNKDKFLTHF